MISYIRTAAIIFLLWMCYRLVKSAIKKALGGIAASAFARSRGDQKQVADMVRDPVCGSYVSTDHAVVSDIGGKRVYFCSEDCLKSYAAEGPNA
ncbi:MAG: hypothetical protein IEMM0002_0576 [bacterium]|nr:MAG: hypothetical protein IEMM0002_0576 [bacterium]